MSADKTVRDRWVAFMAERGFTGHALAADAVKAGMDFSASEVQREHIATEAAQGALAEVLDELFEVCRILGGTPAIDAATKAVATVAAQAAELDRLRAAQAEVLGIDALTKERDDLRAWKESAMAVLREWDSVGAEAEAARPMKIGASTAAECVRIICELRADAERWRNRAADVESIRAEARREALNEVGRYAQAILDDGIEYGMSGLEAFGRFVRWAAKRRDACQPTASKPTCSECHSADLEPVLELKICPHYWGEHDKRCILLNGHSGDHVFPLTCDDVKKFCDPVEAKPAAECCVCARPRNGADYDELQREVDDVVRLLELGRYRDALETLRKVRT